MKPIGQMFAPRTFWLVMPYRCDRCGHTVPFYLEDGCEGPRNGGSEDHRLPADHPFNPGGVVQWDKTLSGRLVVPVPFVAEGCPRCQGEPPWSLSGPCLLHHGRDSELNPPLKELPAGTARFHYPKDPKAPQACGIPIFPPYLMRGAM